MGFWIDLDRVEGRGGIEANKQGRKFAFVKRVVSLLNAKQEKVAEEGGSDDVQEEKRQDGNRAGSSILSFLLLSSTSEGSLLAYPNEQLATVFSFRKTKKLILTQILGFWKIKSDAVESSSSRSSV